MICIIFKSNIMISNLKKVYKFHDKAFTCLITNSIASYDIHLFSKFRPCMYKLVYKLTITAFATTNLSD